MLSETVELTMNHVGLGKLGEAALMAIFGSVEAHALTNGTGNKLDQITTKTGETLYPAVYWARLRVPPSLPLDRFGLLDRVGVGVDVRTVGRMILAWSSVLSSTEQVPTTPESWHDGSLPSMEAGQVFVVMKEGGDESEPASGVPKDGAVSPMKSLAAMPESIDRFRQIRHQGSIDPSFVGTFGSNEPIEYDVMLSRDLAPGRALLFAWVVGILNLVEQAFLARRVWPRFPVGLLRHLAILERETFFLGNVRRESTLLGNVRATLTSCAENFHGTDKSIVSRAILTTCTELYEKDTGNVVVTSKAKKLLAVPRGSSTAFSDAARICLSHAREHEKP